MKKIILMLCCFAFTFSIVSTSFANPCRSIARACMKAGYYQGGNAHGKGLVVNCMLPVTSKKMRLPNTNFSNETLDTCHAMIKEKMKEQMGR